MSRNDELTACSAENKHGRLDTVVLRKLCLQGWPLVGIWELESQEVSLHSKSHRGAYCT